VAREQVEVAFHGGLIAGERRSIPDLRQPYFAWWRGPKPPDTGPNEGPMKDKYEYDAASGMMVYVGTIFGDEDERTMHRMSREDADRWTKLLRGVAVKKSPGRGTRRRR
jgi:hypothetical protein